jgi:hypothetical protein
MENLIRLTKYTILQLKNGNLVTIFIILQIILTIKTIEAIEDSIKRLRIWASALN